MKKSAKPNSPNLDKHLFEAGLQCHKRLWLDYHEPKKTKPSAARAEMSRVGDELRALARTAFPMAVTVDEADTAAAAAKTQELLANNTPVIFDATFVADGVEACCDILVAHKDDAVDLFEIKAGTKVKHRYVNDLALQAIVLAGCGKKLQRAYLLHIQSKFEHKEGEDYPPMELLRSADVTPKVQKQMPNVERRLQQLKLAIGDEGSLELPMGTFCRNPFPCPHVDRCSKEAPELPLHRLPELTRQQEIEFHKEGIEELLAVDPETKGLSLRQRRTIECHQQKQRIVEPFVEAELRACEQPLHFVAMASATEALPRLDRQHPWQMTPYAWAVHTVHEDGRVEEVSFAQVGKEDPRGPFARSLARHVEAGGTILCWNDEPLRELRGLLDAVDSEKPSVRMLMGFEHIDIMQLFEAGVFEPSLFDLKNFGEAAAKLVDDHGAEDHPMLEADVRFEALQKARAPRVRATTRDKIAAELKDALAWQAETLAKVYSAFAGEPVAKAEGEKEPKPRRAASEKTPTQHDAVDESGAHIRDDQGLESKAPPKKPTKTKRLPKLPE
ncbi:MAG: DUF2779 domain-containing protein [Planctomycetota bacterium]